ncbi:unnamed protein product [Orchesella dallaii]
MTSSSPPPPPAGILYRVDGESLNTLIEKYEQSLSTNSTEQERLDKLRQEYVTLKTRLTTLPLQLDYNALVPLGRRALCPGKIIHTNEIMCLLGDNWFVECSSAKAIEIVNHRVTKLDEQHESLRKERELINNWKQEAERQLVETIGEGTVEIREDYDEQHERHWREQHRESVRRYHQQQAKRRVEARQEKSQVEDELWSRLDELELQEDLVAYLEEEQEEEIVEKPVTAVRHAPKESNAAPTFKKDIEDKHNTPPPTSLSSTKTETRIETTTEVKVKAPPARGKRVKFSADNIIHDISDDQNYEKQESYNQERSSVALNFTDDGTVSSYPCFDPIFIRFHHSALTYVDGDENDASGTEEEDQKSQIVSSPGDIVKVFGPTSISAISNKPLPKSILKPYAPPLVLDKRSKKPQGRDTKKPSPISEDDDIDIDSITINESAVSKVVTERVPIFTNLQLNTPSTLNNDSETNASKPVSLFKMRRQQPPEVAVSSPD